HEDLFSSQTFERIAKLRDRLAKLERVQSVVTILDVPLLQASGLRLSEVSSKKLKTLQNPTVDLRKAKEELASSPIYKDLVLSADLRTTALLINLKIDTYYSGLQKERNQLLSKKRSGKLTSVDHIRLNECLEKYEAYSAMVNKLRHQDIESVRSIIRPYQQYGSLLLGGISMIADDMITFVKKDLEVFGVGVFAFIVITLAIIFREIRWIILPLFNCFAAVIIMVGMLGLLNWKVTVISSNFISLMLILTMEMNIHMAVRYTQFVRDYPAESQHEVVGTTMRWIFYPCLYSALTTMLGFASLVTSGIRPVIDFGWMMTIGLAITLLTSFVAFPAVLVLLKKSPPASAQDKQSAITTLLARIVDRHGGKVIIISLVTALLSVGGISKLQVENSFINYFREKTEIYQGMKLIDEKLGGTNPLDIIIKFDEPTTGEKEPGGEESGFSGEDIDWLTDSDPRDYWFTPYKIQRIKEAHDYLDSLPEIGKVLSLASFVRVAEQLNDGKEFDGLELGVLYKKMPEELKANMLDPYVSIEHNEARISVRILDSLKELRRKDLLDKIKTGLTTKCGFSESQVSVAGIMVLYNNMLQSLFRSQILTLGIVLAGIAIQLLILFRSLKLAIICSVPNLLAVSSMLGLMGLLNIPLDMMTITIAAITMGIAVDNSIHYVYRFQDELPRYHDYRETMHVCHRNVGNAILNSATTIIFGFSILVFSNFIPTIYFGIFTGMAMLVAVLAILLLLPKLILMWRPF
ncbi:MAG: MMPL family transporter, partial [Pseudomonadota bacterium]